MPLYVVILLVALTRLLPHPPNFASVGALALFAGYTMRGPRGVLLPLAALLLSDCVGHLLRIPGMGFYNPVMMVFVYGGFAAVVAIGGLTRRSIDASKTNQQTAWLKPGLIASGSIAGASAFFLISNFGYFLGGGYPPNIAGLVACYVAAIPFFLNTLAGDLIFAAILFGTAALARKLDETRAPRTDFAG